MNGNMYEQRSCTELQKLEERLISFVNTQINKRCNAIIEAADDSVSSLIGINIIDYSNIQKFCMPQDLYNNAINNVKQYICHKIEIGINKDRETKKNADKYTQYQNYWLHNAPSNLVKWLFKDLLICISNYFNNNIIFINQNYKENIVDFLRKMFIRNLLCGNLQMNRQSTKHGPIIQYAAWKERKLQKVISNYFDYSYDELWSEWMQLTKPNGKTMRIDSIIINNMKPYSSQRLIQCVDNLRITYNIYIQIQNFQPSQQQQLQQQQQQPSHPQKVRQFQQSSNNNNNNIKQIMDKDRLKKNKDERRKNVDILILQRIDSIERENDELREEVRLLKQQLQYLQESLQLPQQQEQQELKQDPNELSQNVSFGSDDTFTFNTSIDNDTMSITPHPYQMYQSSIYPICPTINMDMRYEDDTILFNEFHPSFQI